MSAAHITTVRPIPGGQEITCSCGTSTTHPITRAQALIIAWRHEDHRTRQDATKSRRRAQAKTRRAHLKRRRTQ